MHNSPLADSRLLFIGNNNESKRKVRTPQKIRCQLTAGCGFVMKLQRKVPQKIYRHAVAQAKADKGENAR